MLWLVDGSGGDSHLWTLSRNWFSEMMHKTPQPFSTRLGDDERSSCFMSELVVKHNPRSSEDDLHTTNDLGDPVADVGHSTIHSMRRPQIFCNHHPSFFLCQVV